MTQNRPLAKALHTVTVVARVAVRLRQIEAARGNPRTAADTEYYTANALLVLGYEDESHDAVMSADYPENVSPLLAACLAAVARELAVQP